MKQKLEKYVGRIVRLNKHVFQEITQGLFEFPTPLIGANNLALRKCLENKVNIFRA
jgi:hypothetical protein